jgi:glycosyltransferase involved in cell wall biosynthesis
MSDSPRLVIDGRALAGSRTGIGVHTAEIASRLGFEPAPLIASHTPIVDRSGIEQLRFRVDRFAPGVAWQQLILGRVAAEEGDVLWGPHGTLPLTIRIPAVVSIHDLTSLTMPLRHRLKTIFSFNTFISRSLEIAAAIAAVSKTTADELIRGFAISPSRVEIVPNGVDPFFSPATDGEAPEEIPFGMPDRGYVLFVGTLEPRKGIGDLLSAWEQLPPPRLPLVLCGGKGWGTTSLLRRIEHHPERGAIIVSGFLPRPQLRALYRSAALFVYPSYYEGFGLPPLEAMACGTAVLAAAGGAIPEVLGDAAELVRPGDTRALAARLSGLLKDERRRRELIEAGIERAARFDWDRSAETMREIMLRVAR